MRKPARRFDRAGYSIPAFAEVLGLNPAQVRVAIKAGQIATVEFAGAVRIPKTEALRVAKLLGHELDESVPDRLRTDTEWDMLQ